MKEQRRHCLSGLKNNMAVILYFALSLFTVMNCELLTDIMADRIFPAGEIHVVYALHSISVSFGVSLLLVLLLASPGRLVKMSRAIMTFPFVVAAPIAAAYAFCTEPTVFWTLTVCLYILAGVNTGFASLCLYRVYAQNAPGGLILAAASLLGLAPHYALFRALTGLASAAGVLAGFVVLAIAVTAWLLNAKIDLPLDGFRIARTGGTSDVQQKRYVQLLIATACSVALISYIIGISDGVTARYFAGSLKQAGAFYPVLFYIPGQAIACLLADVQKGKYIHFMTLAGVILLLPATFFLKSPDDFYLNSGINFFVGGIFLAYIMTSVISVAPQMKRNQAAAILIPGLIYALFCGIGGFWGHGLAENRDIQWIVADYSVLIVMLAFLSYKRITAFRFENPPERDAGFSDVEKDIAAMLVTGYTQGEISHRLHLSAAETEAHFISIRDKVSDGAGGEAEKGFDAAARAYGLTKRESQILRCLNDGRTNAEIASELFIAEETVKFHVKNILKKLPVDGRYNIPAWFDSYKQESIK
jgi:DNA-binding CsgD family transcriptional regulator